MTNSTTVYTPEQIKEGQLFLIDKELHQTSFQVVKKLRWILKNKYGLPKLKVGHAGTLDPLATGLLIICVGKFTKNIDQYQAQIKEYTGQITLGATTPSYDLETEIDQKYPLNHITEELILKAAKSFEGTSFQTPPIYSAIKKEGKRLYKIAREGLTTEIEPRKIHIGTFEITEIKLPYVGFRVVCNKGTYIRSLAFDFGKSLSSGAYLSSLRRTRIGSFTADNAQKIDEFC